MKKVFVSGCYDILHGGHIEFFTQAKKLGDYLIVSFANDNVLNHYKQRKSSIPIEHKKRVLESLSIIDRVVVGTSIDEPGLDFKKEFLEIKPDILAVTEDDKYEEQKRKLCSQTGAEYVVLPKTLNFEKISTTEIINWIKAPKEVPLRVDFAGGWLDVPKLSRPDGFIVNCAITPTVSLNNWPYELGGGLGGSAAYALLTGKNSIQSELDLGVGWQDPAIIMETGLCAWQSGLRPVLIKKINPVVLKGKMALLWTGKSHITYNMVNNRRNYNLIAEASKMAFAALYDLFDFSRLIKAAYQSYCVQIDEGMCELPFYGECAKKYCGGGFGGYALYMFENEEFRNNFTKQKNTILIEPYINNFK